MKIQLGVLDAKSPIAVRMENVRKTTLAALRGIIALPAFAVDLEQSFQTNNALVRSIALQQLTPAPNASLVSPL